jgi:hypothetical protein
MTKRQLDKLTKAKTASLEKVIQSTASYHILQNLIYSQKLSYHPPIVGTKQERVKVDLPFLALNFAYLNKE